MKNFFLSLLLSVFILFPLSGNSATTSLGGRIVLQVEENGEAWYVSPDSRERYYLGRPNDAFSLMREKGVGISDINLKKIPIGLGVSAGIDSDKDGLVDELEKAIGTNHLLVDTDGDFYSDYDEIRTNNNPLGVYPTDIDTRFVSKNLGKIFLQVEGKGEAWYIYPGNGRRYFLGRPSDAFDIMKKLGLGITNNDLNKLIALTPNFSLSDFENRVHELINVERVKYNLPKLKLNKEVSAVARRHSQDLADENKAFTALDSYCSFPIIHHEGLTFGIYHGERLANSGINYHKMSGENIALLGGAAITLTYQAGSVTDNEFDYCSSLQTEWDKTFKSSLDNETDEQAKILIVNSELKKRKEAFEDSRRLRIGSSVWQTMDELAKHTVDGWMNSPGHKKNIIQADYDEAGIGVAYVNSYVISTQVFISRTNCGYEGAACCDRGNYQVCYEPNTCSKGVCVLGE